MPLGQLMQPGVLGAAAPQQAGPGPQQAPTPPPAEYVSGWDGFLQKLSSDSNMQESMVKAGLQMMTPQAHGENGATKALQGVEVGMSNYRANEDRDLNRESARIKQEGQVLDNEGKAVSNETAVATQQDVIDNAAAKAELSKNEAIWAPVMSGLKAENADLTGGRTMAETALRYEQIANVKDEIRDRNSTAGGFDKASADMQDANILASLWTRNRPEYKGKPDKALEDAFAHVTSQGVEKSFADIEASFIEAADLHNLRDEEKRTRIKGEIADTMSRLRKVRAAENQPGGLKSQGGVTMAQRLEAYQALIGQGLSPDEAEARINAAELELN